MKVRNNNRHEEMKGGSIMEMAQGVDQVAQ